MIHIVSRTNNNRIIIRLTIFYLSFFCVGYISPFICVLYVYVLGIYYAYKCNWETLLYLVSFMVVQNIMMIMYANRFGNYTSLFMLSKEVMVYISVLFSFIKRKRCGAYDRTCSVVALLYLVSIFLSFCLSSASIYSRLISIRQFLLPLVLYYFGNSLRIGKKNLMIIGRVIVYFAICIGVIGVLEVFVLNNILWERLPLYQYHVNKGLIFNSYNNVSLNFYTWDLYDIFHVVARRLVSILAEPLATGHFLLFGFVITDHCISRKIFRKLIKIFLFACIILTLSKGAIICLIIYELMYSLKQLSYKNIIRSVEVACILLILAFCVLVSLMSLIPTSSIVIHFNGLLEGLMKSELIGAELGSAGVITAMLSGNAAEVAESYIGVLCIQCGYIGLGLFLVFFSMIVLYLIRLYKLTKNTYIYCSACLLFAIIIESFFSESSIAFLTSGLYFVFAGISSSMHLKQMKILPLSDYTNFLLNTTQKRGLLWLTAQKDGIRWMYR